MTVYTQMAARIGLSTSQSLIQVSRQKFGKGISILLGIGIFAVTGAFQAGNSIGAGITFGELFHLSATPFVLIISLLAIALLFLPSFYRILEKLMIALVALMLAAFFLTLLTTTLDWREMFHELQPQIPQGSFPLLIAMVASSFSVVGACYQSYLVQEKGWKMSESALASREALSGIFILGIITFMVMAVATTVLKPQQIQVNSAMDMALTLEPLFGRFTSIVFMLGLLGASFSSLLGNATVGGSILADTFSLGRNLNSWPVRGCIMFLIALGAGIAIRFGKLPLELIIFAQGITIIIVPLIGLVILILANDKEIMGSHVNRPHQNVWGVLGIIVLVFLAIKNIMAILN